MNQVKDAVSRGGQVLVEEAGDRELVFHLARFCFAEEAFEEFDDDGCHHCGGAGK